MTRVFLACALAALCGCPSDEPEVVFEADYAASYVEVRDCRRSGGEHEVNFFRVLASPDALASYNDRAAPFGDDAVVIKEEYDFADSMCAGPIIQWSVMRKDSAAVGDLLGWRWQRVSAARAVLENDTSRCFGCHQGCGVPPDGFDGTCTVP